MVSETIEPRRLRQSSDENVGTEHRRFRPNRGGSGPWRQRLHRVPTVNRTIREPAAGRCRGSHGRKPYPTWPVRCVHIYLEYTLQHRKRLVDMSHTLMPREQSSLVLNQCISCGG